MKPGMFVECECGSERVSLMSSEDGVDVYRCSDCFDWFETDNFVPHGRKHNKVRKMRATDE